MKKNDKLTIKKVPLKEFIDALMQVYEEGVMFIDIIGKGDDQQDYIGIAVYDDYYKKEEPNELTDEDINKLV